MTALVAGPRRDLRIFLGGQVTSVFGNVLTTTATSVVAVVGLHAGAGAVALITAGALLPALVFGPFAGVLLDRVRQPRRMLLAVDMVSAAAAGGCAIAAVAGVLDIGWLVGLNLVLGCGSVAVEGLYFPHLAGLGVPDLGSARGSLQSSEMLARSVGSAVAGPLAAAVGAALLFLGDALSYLVNAACLVLLAAPDRRAPATRTRQPLRVEFRDGLDAVRGHRALAGYLAFLLLNGIAAGGVAAQRAVFLLDDIRLPVALFTVPLLVATLVGAVSSKIAPWLLTHGLPPARLLLVALPAGAITAALLPAAPGTLALAVAAACLGTALPLLCNAAANIAVVTLISDEIGDEFFGRVATLFGAAATLSSLLGAVLGGVLGDRLGVRAGIWVCVGIGVAAAIALVLRTRSRPA